jgi:hypothetical protein
LTPGANELLIFELTANAELVELAPAAHRNRQSTWELRLHLLLERGLDAEAGLGDRAVRVGCEDAPTRRTAGSPV